SQLAELLFEACGIPGGKEPRLFDPAIAADAARKLAEPGVDTVDRRIVPPGDVVEAGDAETVKEGRELGAYALDPGQVVMRRRRARNLGLDRPADSRQALRRRRRDR